MDRWRLDALDGGLRSGLRKLAESDDKGSIEAARFSHLTKSLQDEIDRCDLGRDAEKLINNRVLKGEIGKFSPRLKSVVFEVLAAKAELFKCQDRSVSFLEYVLLFASDEGFVTSEVTEDLRRKGISLGGYNRQNFAKKFATLQLEASDVTPAQRNYLQIRKLFLHLALKNTTYVYDAYYRPSILMNFDAPKHVRSLASLYMSLAYAVAYLLRIKENAQQHGTFLRGTDTLVEELVPPEQLEVARRVFAADTNACEEFVLNLLDNLDEPCSDCDGKGRVPCDQCGGSGYLEECDACHGAKTQPCACAEGLTPCSECNGTGKGPPRFLGLIKSVCESCSGEGMVPHYECKGQGSVPCSKCIGKGMVDSCLECSAKGHIGCATCCRSGRFHM